MKTIFKLSLFLASISLLFQSCAVIVGGSKYNAYVNVNNPNAQIRYNGSTIGTGNAFVSIPRKDANRVIFKVSQEGCEEQTFTYTKRVFRGWSFVGSLLLAPVAGGVPIPIWNLIDIASGASYKPDKNHPDIRKESYKNYYYQLNYNCGISSPNLVPVPAQGVKVEKTKEQKLLELKDLYDKGMITEDEYKKSRQVILNQ